MRRSWLKVSAEEKEGEMPYVENRSLTGGAQGKDQFDTRSGWGRAEVSPAFRGRAQGNALLEVDVVGTQRCDNGQQAEQHQADKHSVHDDRKVETLFLLYCNTL